MPSQVLSLPPTDPNPQTSNLPIAIAASQNFLTLPSLLIPQLTREGSGTDQARIRQGIRQGLGTGMRLAAAGGVGDDDA
ncbi:hypothetical protein M758_7G058500 [Ceratodon purpureus]|nr:hypothetical protein M758_7G058500 [Ceratodon purpureus]